MIQKSAAGMGISQIAREENRNRESVARIVNGDEVQEIVRCMRAEFYRMANAASAAVRYTLEERKDGRLGYQVLLDIGVIPRPEETEANAFEARQRAPKVLAPGEQATQDESERISPWQLEMIRTMEQKAAMFHYSLPTTDELRHKQTVTALINEMTAGKSNRVPSDPQEWTRLEALAEDVLQGKRTLADTEIAAFREKYAD